MRWTGHGNASSAILWATGVVLVTRSTGHGGHYAPARVCLPSANFIKLEKVFASDDHVKVEATWSIYQKIVVAYRNPSKPEGKKQLQKVIASLSRGIPKQLSELASLGRIFKGRPTRYSFRFHV